MNQAQFRNGPESFGLVTRILHWLTAAGVLTLLGLGPYIANMQVTLGNLWLFGLHKTIGITVFGLTCLRWLWHRYSPPPRPFAPASLRSRAAIAVHRAVYVLLVAMPLLGWAASSATGLDVVVFGGWVLPPLAPPSQQLEAVFFGLHTACGAAMAVLLILHIAGALVRRDGTLRRMVFGVAAH